MYTKANKLANKSMIKKSLITSSLIGLFLSVGVIAHPDFDDESEPKLRTYEHKQGKHRDGQERKAGRHGGMDRLRMAFAQLDLSEQQKEALKSLKESNKESMKANFDAMKNLKKQMRPLLEAETIDENAIKNLSTQIADLKAEQIIKMAMIKNQAIDLLSEEQKAKFDDMKQKHQKAMKERRSED